MVGSWIDAWDEFDMVMGAIVDDVLLIYRLCETAPSWVNGRMHLADESCKLCPCVLKYIVTTAIPALGSSVAVAMVGAATSVM